MRMMTLLLGLALAGCGPNAAEDEATHAGGDDNALPDIDAPEDDGPYLDDPEETTPPDLDAEAISCLLYTSPSPRD